MITIIRGEGVNDLLEEAIFTMKTCGVKEETRNGPALVIPNPVILEMKNPRNRVLFSPVRDANPFYHMMEAIWMFAGMRDVRWLGQFNKRVYDYCDPGVTHWHAAYGHRWRSHFYVDQIKQVHQILSSDLTSRRAVIAMWDPTTDLDSHKDLPCNTHIYFRVVNDKLDMTVCNRSNDLIWGALGANAVHMTMLHELMASALGIRLGMYRVFTHNLHVYTNMPKFSEIMDNYVGLYSEGFLGTEKLLGNDESLSEFLDNAVIFVLEQPVKGQWFSRVAAPALALHRTRKADLVPNIQDSNWRLACQEWLERRMSSSAT